MKRFSLVFLILFIVLILTGCNGESSAIESDIEEYTSLDSSDEMVFVYYLNDGYFTPVAYSVEKTDSIVNTAIELLFSGTIPEGFKNELANAKINSLNICGDVVSIDISGESLENTNIELARNQIVYTLTECENVFRITLSIDGKTQGTLMERPPYVNIVDTEKFEEDKMEQNGFENYLTIYYPDSERQYLIPVTIKSDLIGLEKDENNRQLLHPGTLDKAKAAIVHLISGTKEIESLKTINEKMVRNLFIKGDVAEIDFDRNMLTKFINERKYAEIAVESLVRTLTSIDGINKVQFLINGKNMGNVTGNLSLKNPIEPQRFYNILTK